MPVSDADGWETVWFTIEEMETKGEPKGGRKGSIPRWKGKGSVGFQGRGRSREGEEGMGSQPSGGTRRGPANESNTERTTC